MTLADAKTVLETMLATERLNYLDDLLTTALTAPGGVSDDDRSAALAIGDEIVNLLRRLRDEVVPIRELIHANAELFDERTEELLAQTKGAITADVQPLRAAGWHAVAIDAIRVIEDSVSVEEEITNQLEELAGGTAIAGDFPRLFKCSLYIGLVAMGVAGSLLAGPIGPPTAMAAMSTAGLGVFGIPGMCKGVFPRSGPDSASP